MHPAYTEEELRRFEEELAAREAELNAKAQRLSQETEALGRSQGRLEAQKRELQQVTGRAGWTRPLSLWWSLSRLFRGWEGPWPLCSSLVDPRVATAILSKGRRGPRPRRSCGCHVG